MRRFSLILFAGILLSLPSPGQDSLHYKIAVIGSSTAVGTGANPIQDSSWVKLTEHYLQGLKYIDTIYNEAAGGTTTRDGDSDLRDTSLIPVLNKFNPDLVIISYVSNDAVGDILPSETMARLRKMRDTVLGRGKICWITTPHPRDSLKDNSLIYQLQDLDSTYAEFPTSNLDFWDCLVATDGVDIAPQYDIPKDGVHVNNAGHYQLFQVVKAANILSSLITPLALITDSFSAVPQGGDILVDWVSSSMGPARFVVQRSPDGDNFTAVGQQTADDNVPGTRYSWADPAPVMGRNYYRLQTTANGNTTYSRIASVTWKGASWGIDKLYLPQGGSQLSVAISSDKNRNVLFSVFDATGRVLASQQGYAAAPETLFTVPVTGLAQGQYFLRVVSADGEVSTKPFLKW